MKVRLKLFNMLLIVFAATFLFLCQPSILQAKEQVKYNRKAIIFIVDQIQVSDLLEAETPNIDKLISNGGFGLMNVRPEAIINTNRASSYLALGMGIRITAPERKEWRLEKLNERSWTIENVTELKQAINDKKTERFGFIGQKAKDLNLKVALSGSAESALIAIDNQGVIPIVSLGSNLQKDQINELLNQSDILFIDTGETVRAHARWGQIGGVKLQEEIIRAIEVNDRLIGEVVSEVGLNNNLFMVITPNPSPLGLKDINLSLTPVILSEPNGKHKQGILTSISTRREGLVTNLNFAPTILSFFGQRNLGDPITITPTSSDNKSMIAKNERLYLNLNKTRYLLHGTFIFVIFFIFFLLYQKCLSKWQKKEIITWFSLITINIPLASLIAPMVLDYSRIFVGHLFIVLVALLITWLIRKLVESFLLSLGISSIFTALIILIDLLRGGSYLVNTPFGFNDVIIGGRFYGVNNDLMGILIGSTLLGTFMLAEYLKLNKKKVTYLGVILLGFNILVLSPLYGANVGGTISAIVILIILILTIFNYKLTLLRIIAVTTLVLLLELGIAALDATLNKELTHAGKLYLSVMNNGIYAFIEMVSIKLSQIGLMLVLPPWNFVLFYQWYLIWSLVMKQKAKLSLLKNEFGYVYSMLKVGVIGSLVVFAFNDTGVIAAAIILTYVLIPTGYFLKAISKEVTL